MNASAPNTSTRASSGIAKPKAPQKFDPKRTSRDLSQAETLNAALVAITSAGPSAKTLAPEVQGLLEIGLPPNETLLALQALGAIGAQASSAAIAPYTHHRNEAVRTAAISALSQTGGKESREALVALLHTSDPKARSLAAVGLEKVGDASAIADLTRVFDRGVLEAIYGMAAHCQATQCDAVFSRFDLLQLDAQKAVVTILFQRKAPPSDDVLILAVSRLLKTAAASEKAYFVGLKQTYKGSKKVLAVLEEAARPDKPAAGSSQKAGN